MVRRIAGTGGVLMLLAACGATASLAPAPTGSASPELQATASPSPHTGAPTPSTASESLPPAGATPGPTALTPSSPDCAPTTRSVSGGESPAPGMTFATTDDSGVLSWARAAGPGPLEAYEIRAAAEYRGTFVVVGTRLVDLGPQLGAVLQPGIWTSDDGFAWALATFDGRDLCWNVRVLDVTVGPDGFIAVGDWFGTAAVWLSADGRRWNRIQDAGFTPGRMRHVGVTGQGIVAFGDVQSVEGQESRSLIWTSVDGVEWLRATNETGLAVAAGVDVLVESGSELWAFHRGFSFDGSPAPAEVWRTGGRAEWVKLAELPASSGLWIDAAARGASGWVVTGGGRAWTSRDGFAWELAPTGPQLLYTLLAHDAGFVGVSVDWPDAGCSFPDDAFIGQTWVSPDGRTWRPMTAEIFTRGQAIHALLERDRALIGVGVTYEFSFGPTGAIWAAPLPTTFAAASPAPSPTPAATNAGCGG